MNKKKILSIVFGLALSIPLASGISFAASSADVDGEFGILDATGGTGSTLLMELSPGVHMSYLTAANEFALTTMNANAQVKYRLEYAIWSPKAGYYQREVTVTTDLPTDITGYTINDVLDDPFEDDWTYMGNAN